MENIWCKGCTATVRLTQEEMDKIFGETMRVKNVKLVTEDEYNNRLDKCMSCEYLDYGTTCRFCGCIVQIRAKLAGSGCPYPYEPRW